MLFDFLHLIYRQGRAGAADRFMDPELMEADYIRVPLDQVNRSFFSNGSDCLVNSKEHAAFSKDRGLGSIQVFGFLVIAEGSGCEAGDSPILVMQGYDQAVPEEIIQVAIPFTAFAD